METRVVITGMGALTPIGNDVDTFWNNAKEGKSGIDFITFAISAKPNTKNKNIIRQKEIVEKFLDENSAAYRKRRSRLATKNSYHKAVIKYYSLVINQSNK